MRLILIGANDQLEVEWGENHGPTPAVLVVSMLPAPERIWVKSSRYSDEHPYYIERSGIAILDKSELKRSEGLAGT